MSLISHKLYSVLLLLFLCVFVVSTTEQIDKRTRIAMLYLAPPAAHMMREEQLMMNPDYPDIETNEVSEKKVGMMPFPRTGRSGPKTWSYNLRPPYAYYEA